MSLILKRFFQRLLNVKEDPTDILHQFLREQVLVTLCTKVPSTMSVTIVIATSLIIFLWPYINHVLIAGWYTAVVLLAFERIYYSMKGCRYGSDRPLRERYQRFRVEVILMVLLWAFAAFFLYPQGHLPQELLLALIVVGMAGGGTITLAIDRKMANAYVILILTPLAIRFFMCGDAIHLMLSALSFFYIAIFLLSTRQIGKVLEKGIRQHRELGELRQRLDLIADQAPVGILYFDKEYNLQDCNKALSDQIGVPKEELLKLNMLELKDQRPVKNIKKVIEEERTIYYEGPYLTTLNDKEMWISVVFSPLHDDSGELIGGIAVLQDKSVEHEAMERAEFLAYHDGLTHLPNRKLLEDRYRLQIAQAAREKFFSALFFLDLDRFKHINDTYGHKVGDELLKETAQRLQSILRQSDTVCRLGGDEFIIFLPMISRDLKECVDDTWRIGKKIHKALAKPYDIEGHQLFVTTSIGAVIIFGDSEPLDEILRKADIAMYHAKKRGRGMTSFYEEEMDLQLRRAIKLEHELRHAIDREQLYLQYQPIIDISQEKIHGAEALLRWQLPDGMLIPPSEFIPVAEESKLIHQIGHWVIEEVCRRLKEWGENGLSDFNYISINISSKQFKHHGFYDEVMHIVRKYGIDPKMLKFEITESMLMEENDLARDIISRFNEAGIGFMIDDFGTGYSSLSYLKQFEFETIKIDKSFIRDILTDEDDVALVRAILDIAKQFSYSVIAEGVENIKQKNRLKMIDRTMLCQGYYFSRPLDEEDFVKRLKK